MSLRRSIAALSSVGAICVILLMASSAGATTTPFKATPSYAAYGGLHYVGHAVVASGGSGNNKLTTLPSFAVATGIDRQGQAALSVNNGNYAIEVYSGLQNLSFSCGSSCQTGSHSVSLEWNVTWYGHLNTSCAPTSSKAVLAAVNLSIFVAIVDQSTATVVGSHLQILFSHSLYGRGALSGGFKSGLYFPKFNAALTSGHSYTLVTYFESFTWTLASAPTGSSCGSGAIARVGVGSPTTLEYVMVS